MSMDFTELLDAARQVRPATKLDNEVQEIAIRALAHDFLNVPDLSLDLRAYMVETTLPTLIFALEKLLREVEKKHLLGDGSDSGGSTLPASRNAPTEKLTDQGIGTGLATQLDKPVEQFDCINWLAQFLYRNNPRFSNFADANSSPYLQSMQTATAQLKERLFEVEATQRAKRRAEELQRRQAEERAERLREAQEAERVRGFRELLGTAFRKWVGRLWRPANGTVSHNELLQAYRKVFGSDGIQSNPELMMRLNDVITALSPGGPARGDSTSGLDASSTDLLSKGRDIPGSPATEPVSQPQGAAETKSDIPAIDIPSQWDLETYLAMSQRLMYKWSVDDLSLFLRELSEKIDQDGEALKEQFKDAVVMPRFEGEAVITKEEWLRRLRGVAERYGDEMGQGKEGKAGEEASRIRDRVLEFCKDNVHAKRMSSAGKTSSMARISESDMAVEAIVPDVQDIAPELVAPPANPTVAVAASQGVFEAEAAYRGFVKQLVGEMGVEPVKRFMEYCERTSGTDSRSSQQGSEQETVHGEGTDDAKAGRERTPPKVPDRPSTADLQKIRAYQLFDVISPATPPDASGAASGTISVRKLNALLETAAATPGISPPVQTILQNTRFDDVVHDGEESAITKTEFSRQLTEKWSEVGEAEVAECLTVLTTVFRNDRELTSVSGLGTSVSGPATSVSGPAAKDETEQTKPLAMSPEREAAELRTLRAIAHLSQDVGLSVSGACQATLALLGGVMKEFHPDLGVRSRTSLYEHVVNDASTVDSNSSSGVEVGMKVLRCVAATGEWKAKVGRIEEEDVNENQPEGGVKEDEGMKRDGLSRQVMLTIGDTESDDDGEDVTGVLSLGISTGDGMLGALDVDFLKKATTVLTSVVTRIATREKTMILAHAAKKWTEQQSGVTVEVFLPESAEELELSTLLSTTTAEMSTTTTKPESQQSSMRLFRLDELGRPATSADASKDGQKGMTGAGTGEIVEGTLTQDQVIVEDSPYLRPRSAFLKRIDETDERDVDAKKVYDLLASSTKPGQGPPTSTDEPAPQPPRAPTPSEDGTTYLPIYSASGHATAILRIKPLVPQTALPPDTLQEVHRTMSILSRAIADIQPKPRQTTRSRSTRSLHITGKSIQKPKPTKRIPTHMLFPHLLLLNTREALSTLTSNHMSELRSYRKPPPTIHKVVKGVLYLFGKLPKEVRKWSDCVRLLSGELLKKMIEFDPTAPRKKGRGWRRVKRVLRSIPHGDVKKRGSIPAERMADWLLVSVDLHDRAIKKRKQEQEEEAEEAEEEGEEEPEGEAEEEGDDPMDQDDSTTTTTTTATTVLNDESKTGDESQTGDESNQGEKEANEREFSVTGGGSKPADSSSSAEADPTSTDPTTGGGDSNDDANTRTSPTVESGDPLLDASIAK
ncbi:EF-hand calcium-binding domain-containing protein 5 [Gaertneriomyces sp. JEL0708]|nr:EF-hand calcium-binding domain-containing protein 5 [Gaertneriomyces sp. JEL0708]